MIVKIIYSHDFQGMFVQSFFSHMYNEATDVKLVELCIAV